MIILLVFVVQAHAKINQTHNSMVDNLVAGLVEKLFDLVLRASPHGLVKPGVFTIPSLSFRTSPRHSAKVPRPRRLYRNLMSRTLQAQSFESPSSLLPSSLPPPSSLLPPQVQHTQNESASNSLGEMESYFSDVYGSRWTALKIALARSVQHVALENSLVGLNQSRIGVALGKSSDGYSLWNCKLHSFQTEADDKYPMPLVGASGVKLWYWMDLASLFPALALKPEKGQSILDMCAAPGGKSLALAQQLFEGEEAVDQGVLTCNEIDTNRRARLRKVIMEYIPESLQHRVKVTPFDGKNLHKKGVLFDAVLVDAPCSAERHWIMDATPKNRIVDKSDWSPARCKRYAKDQFALVRSALNTLKVGGRIVYSTCSIAPVENDEVISKVLKKFGGVVRVIDAFANHHSTLTDFGAEKTKYGWLMLPDRSRFGPLYWVALEKTQPSQGDA